MLRQRPNESSKAARIQPTSSPRSRWASSPRQPPPQAMEPPVPPPPELPRRSAGRTSTRDSAAARPGRSAARPNGKPFPTAALASQANGPDGQGKLGALYVPSPSSCGRPAPPATKPATSRANRALLAAAGIFHCWSGNKLPRTGSAGAMGCLRLRGIKTPCKPGCARGQLGFGGNPQCPKGIPAGQSPGRRACQTSAFPAVALHPLWPASSRWADRPGRRTAVFGQNQRFLGQSVQLPARRTILLGGFRHRKILQRGEFVRVHQRLYAALFAEG